MRILLLFYQDRDSLHLLNEKLRLFLVGTNIQYDMVIPIIWFAFTLKRSKIKRIFKLIYVAV